MAAFWWEDKEDDDEEDYEENPNVGARKVYLEEKGINAYSLAKRFNEIIKAQSQTVDASLYAADREYKRFLRYVKKEQELEDKYQTYVDIWNSVIYNIKTFGFYEAKERVNIDLDGLENAKTQKEKWKEDAYKKTLGVGPNVIEAWANSFANAVHKHSQIEAQWQKKADEQLAKVKKLKKSLNIDTTSEEIDVKDLAESFSKDYKTFEQAYPEDEFVEKMKKMITSAYNKYLGVGADLVIGLANKIAYGTTKNVFAESVTKDEGVER